jgi:hypothetical protein
MRLFEDNHSSAGIVTKPQLAVLTWTCSDPRMPSVSMYAPLDFLRRLRSRVPWAGTLGSLAACKIVG